MSVPCMSDDQARTSFESRFMRCRARDTDAYPGIDHHGCVLLSECAETLPSQCTTLPQALQELLDLARAVPAAYQGQSSEGRWRTR